MRKILCVLLPVLALLGGLLILRRRLREDEA